MVTRSPRKNQPIGKRPIPVIPKDFGPEATRLLKCFWALTPTNQYIAVHLLQALLKNQRGTPLSPAPSSLP